MLEDKIDDEEILYRRVPTHIKGLIKQLPNGGLGVSSTAFLDTGYRPSVDRAKLRGNDPKQTLGTMAGGVVSLKTGDVRSIENLVQYDNKTKQIVCTFISDVEPKPIFDCPDEPDNPAHAEIYIHPPCTRKIFERLRERLALLANNRPWEIVPPTDI